MERQITLAATGLAVLALLASACQPGTGPPSPAGVALGLPESTETFTVTQTPAADMVPPSNEPPSRRAAEDGGDVELVTGVAIDGEAADLTSPLAADPVPGADSGTGNADVLQVRAVEVPGGSWIFHVTVSHPDSGWDDYADGWDVVAPDGTVLKTDPDSPFTRLLLHPHENEQPFTRSQSGLLIPAGVSQVRVRAHDLVDGFGGREVLVNLSASEGPDFFVERVAE